MIIQHRNFGEDRVIRCGIHEHTHNYGSHIHQHSEIVYVLEGSIESTVDGVTETVNAGEMVVITPLRVHSTYTSAYCKIFICVFSNDFVLNFLSSKELYGGYERSVFKPSDILHLYITEKFIPSALNYRPNNINKIRSVQAGLHAILEEYLLSTSHSEKRSAFNNTLAQILIYMNEHYKEKLTLSDVGKALGYTACYISHCMEALPEMNFNDILNSFRVEHAKTLLLSSGKTNIDIALESGFTCERSFYRAFTKAVKMTPKEYVALRSASGSANTPASK